MATPNFKITITDDSGQTVRTSLASFARANADDPWLAKQVAKLRPGESIDLGGGAAPAVIVTRQAEGVRANGSGKKQRVRGTRDMAIFREDNPPPDFPGDRHSVAMDQARALRKSPWLRGMTKSARSLSHAAQMEVASLHRPALPNPSDPMVEVQKFTARFGRGTQTLQDALRRGSVTFYFTAHERSQAEQAAREAQAVSGVPWEYIIDRRWLTGKDGSIVVGAAGSFYPAGSTRDVEGPFAVDGAKANGSGQKQRVRGTRTVHMTLDERWGREPDYKPRTEFEQSKFERDQLLFAKRRGLDWALPSIREVHASTLAARRRKPALPNGADAAWEAQHSAIYPIEVRFKRTIPSGTLQGMTIEDTLHFANMESAQRWIRGVAAKPALGYHDMRAYWRKRGR